MCSCAVVIEVSSHLMHRSHDQSIVNGLPKPDFNITFLPLECERALVAHASICSVLSGSQSLELNHERVS